MPGQHMPAPDAPDMVGSSLGLSWSIRLTVALYRRCTMPSMEAKSLHFLVTSRCMLTGWAAASKSCGATATLAAASRCTAQMVRCALLLFRAARYEGEISLRQQGTETVCCSGACSLFKCVACCLYVREGACTPTGRYPFLHLQTTTGSEERIQALLRNANTRLLAHSESRRRLLQLKAPAVLVPYQGALSAQTKCVNTAWLSQPCQRRFAQLA